MTNKPYVRTKEHGQKISAAKMGHSVSEETRQKLSQKIRKLDYDEIVKLYKSGMEQPEIADLLKTSRSTISKVLRSEIPKAERDKRRYALISEKMQGNKNGTGKQLTEAGLNKMKDRWGEKNPNWKGDDATNYSGHARAQRKFDMTGKVCERCGNQAQVRHHKDENPKNNPDDAENIENLCRACHARHHLTGY